MARIMPARRLAWLVLASFAMLVSWSWRLGPDFREQWAEWAVAVMLAALWAVAYIALIARLLPASREKGDEDSECDC